MRPTIAAAAALALALAAAMPARAHAQTTTARELLPFDEPVKRNFSASAARASDVLVTSAVLMPFALELGRGFGPDERTDTLMLGESLALSVAVNTATKHLVRRARPYTHNADPRVEAYARREGGDARLSFYSGHASTAFAAAVAGGSLFAHASNDTAARTAVWGTGLALAGATSALRVRAGKHFTSDVVVGALVGAAIGWAVPAVQGHGVAVPALSAPEWIAIGAAPLAGALAASLVPMPSDITEPLVVPWVSGSGGGLTLVRRF